jgi:hypothetical protein
MADGLLIPLQEEIRGAIDLRRQWHSRLAARLPECHSMPGLELQLAARLALDLPVKARTTTMAVATGPVTVEGPHHSNLMVLGQALGPATTLALMMPIGTCRRQLRALRLQPMRLSTTMRGISTVDWVDQDQHKNDHPWTGRELVY